MRIKSLCGSNFWPPFKGGAAQELNLYLYVVARDHFFSDALQWLSHGPACTDGDAYLKAALESSKGTDSKHRENSERGTLIIQAERRENLRRLITDPKIPYPDCRDLFRETLDGENRNHLAIPRFHAETARNIPMICTLQDLADALGLLRADFLLDGGNLRLSSRGFLRQIARLIEWFAEQVKPARQQLQREERVWIDRVSSDLESISTIGNQAFATVDETDRRGLYEACPEIGSTIGQLFEFLNSVASSPPSHNQVMRSDFRSAQGGSLPPE